jgi:hypothetical protein
MKRRGTVSLNKPNGIRTTTHDTNEPIDDTVNHPVHYNTHPSGVECIEIVQYFSFNVGNVIKYCWRAGLKNPESLEDLKKAQFYLRREIARLEKENPS